MSVGDRGWLGNVIGGFGWRVGEKVGGGKIMEGGDFEWGGGELKGLGRWESI